MTASAIPFIYGNREFVAQSGTLLLGVLVVLAASNLAVRHEPAAATPTIQITLADPPLETPKPPPVVEPARPRMEKAPTTTPRRAIPQEMSAVAAALIPAPAPPAMNLPDLPVSPVAKAIPERVEPPRPSNGAAEGRFTQDVRARIEQKKVFPDTARDLGMSGAVEIVYILDRAGKLQRAEIAASSGYPLLDQAAVRAVRSAAYPAFPEDAWVGEKQKEFRTKLIFTITD